MMKCVVGGWLFALAALGTGAVPVWAQVAWDSPMLLAPGSPGGWGAHILDPSRGGGIGVMGTYRSSPAPVGYGFRVGLADDAVSDLALFGGVDVSGHLLLPSDERPFGVLWLAGAGLGVGDDVLLSFPAGLSFGADIETDGLMFRPYVAPRVVLDALFGGPADGLDLGIAVDLGVDLAFSPAWVVRFGATVGDRDALSIGLQLPPR